MILSWDKFINKSYSFFKLKFKSLLHFKATYWLDVFSQAKNITAKLPSPSDCSIEYSYDNLSTSWEYFLSNFKIFFFFSNTLLNGFSYSHVYFKIASFNLLCLIAYDVDLDSLNPLVTDLLLVLTILDVLLINSLFNPIFLLD